MALVVYEYQPGGDAPKYFCLRKQVISYRQSNLVFDETLFLSGYVIPLVLMGDTKGVLSLWLSTSQLSRVAKYLKTKRWYGGFTMYPIRSWPETVIHAISEMPELIYNPRENRLRTEWGLAFALDDADILIEWIPEDREAVSKSLDELAKESYRLRSEEPEEKKPQIDIEGWKRHLFSV